MTSNIKYMETHLKIVKDNGDSFLRLTVENDLAETERASIRAKLRKINPTVSSRNPANCILEQRLEAIEDTLSSKKTIFPLISLRMALQHNLVQRMLIDMGQNEDTANLTASQICSSYCRIMAVLLKIEKPESILTFLDENIDDSCLPLETCDSGFYKDGQSFNIPRWKRFHYQSFDEFQQACLTPFLARPDGIVHHYKLSIPPLSLPIVERKSIKVNTGASLDGITEIVPMPLGEGAQGTVTAIKLHPLSCHFESFPFQHRDGWLAMKERSRSTSWNEFVQEAYVWMAFNRKRPGGLRICPLLCTFQIEHDDQVIYYLIFPLASGPLPKLWARHPNGGDKGALTPKWLTTELFQLADTLSLVHNDDQDNKLDTGLPEFGRFGDIKPDNILWFADYVGCKDAGALLFTDLGLAKCHRRMTKSNSFPAKVRHSETYKAPEFAYTDYPIGIGRKADIWSFGCTLLEHLTWYLLGNNPLTRQSPFLRKVEDLVDRLQIEAENNVNINFSNFKDFSDVSVEDKTPLDVFADIRDEPDLDHPKFSQDRFFSINSQKDKIYIRTTVVGWMRFLHQQEKCSPFIHDLLSFIQKRMLDVNCQTRATAQEVKATMADLSVKVHENPVDYGLRHSKCTSSCQRALRQKALDLPFRY